MSDAAASQGHVEPTTSRLKRLGQTIRRAFAEFLKLPSFIVVAFLLLAAGTTALDHSGWETLKPLRATMRLHFFRNGEATNQLLSTIAGGIITVTSITFSLLLLAVQQAAAALTPQVYDQFLRRRVNQIYFGFFVGLALYTLIILTTVDPPYNPVFGASAALLLTIIALMLIILLLYTTINQMRPTVVIAAIHDYTLLARQRQRAWLLQTRRSPQLPATDQMVVRTTAHGYVVRIDVAAIAEATKRAQGAAEVVLMMAVGSYVAFDDVLAEIRGVSSSDAADLEGAVKKAVGIEQQRDLDVDPAYGIEQLSNIGWTSISTAKSNPSPGLMVLRSFRDLIARWSADEADIETRHDVAFPVVYRDDLLSQLMDALETLAVVASESMQPQTMAELARNLTSSFERLPAPYQARAEDLIRRSLSALGDHVLTAELNAALSGLVRMLQSTERLETARQVQAAQEGLRLSIGKLGSRATRVPKPG